MKIILKKRLVSNWIGTSWLSHWNQYAWIDFKCNECDNQPHNDFKTFPIKKNTEKIARMYKRNQAILHKKCLAAINSPREVLYTRSQLIMCNLRRMNNTTKETARKRRKREKQRGREGEKPSTWFRFRYQFVAAMCLILTTTPDELLIPQLIFILHVNCFGARLCCVCVRARQFASFQHVYCHIYSIVMRIHLF